MGSDVSRAVASELMVQLETVNNGTQCVIQRD